MMPLGFDHRLGASVTELRPTLVTPWTVPQEAPLSVELSRQISRLKITGLMTSKRPCFPFHLHCLSLQLIDTPFLCLFQPHLLPSKPETAVCNSASSRLLQRKDLFFSVQLQVSSLFLHGFFFIQKMETPYQDWLSSPAPINKVCKYTKWQWIAFLRNLQICWFHWRTEAFPLFRKVCWCFRRSAGCVSEKKDQASLEDLLNYGACDIVSGYITSEPVSHGFRYLSRGLKPKLATFCLLHILYRSRMRGPVGVIT